MAHVGVLRVLEERGYEVTAIAGSSIGSLVGGAYAVGCMNELTDWIVGLTEGQILDLFDFSLTGKGVMVGDKIYQQLANLGLTGRIEDLGIPFSAVAVDMLSKREKAFYTGDLLTAIRASAAIPPYFDPVMLDGMELLDGGISNPLPIAYLQKQPDDLTLVVDLGAAIPYMVPEDKVEEVVQAKRDYRHMLLMLGKVVMQYIPEGWLSPKKQENEELYDMAFDIMQDRISQFILAKFQPEIHVQLSRDACEVFEFQRAAELIEAGARAAHKALDAYEASPDNQVGYWTRFVEKFF